VFATFNAIDLALNLVSTFVVVGVAVKLVVVGVLLGKSLV
jgi:hypothetical protein